MKPPMIILPFSAHRFRMQTCLVVLNLSDKTHNLKFDLPSRDARCLFSTHMLEGETVSLEELKIAPFEIFVGELRSAA